MDWTIYLSIAFGVIVLVVAVGQRHRIRRLEARLGRDGIGLSIEELHDEVKRLVSFTSLEILARSCAIEARVLELTNSGDPTNGVSVALELLHREIDCLSETVASSTAEDRASIAMSIRSLGAVYLQHARSFWGSAEPYQDAHRRVQASLRLIASLANVEESARLSPD